MKRGSMDIAIIKELRGLKGLLDLHQCGALVGFAEKTVRKWIKAGKLGAFLLSGEWRIASDVLADYLEERWVKTA